MPRTDNRPVQQALIVVAVILGATIAAAFAFGKWAVFVPIVMIPAWRFSRGLVVGQQMAREGWSGHRFKNYWVYEEMQGKDKLSLSLRLDRMADERLVLVLPTEAEWRRTMPLWAVDRYAEITGRVAGAFPPEDVRRP